MACDSIEPVNGSLQQKLRKVVVPVIFRLLYSSGLRVGEARKLKRSDVDLNTGLVAVNHTKGGVDHYIVLHKSMLELIKVYDVFVDKLLCDRVWLFPDDKDRCHKNKWLSDQFKICWYKYNKEVAYARELRHNYAIENIDSWDNEEYDTYGQIVALKNSMGHSKLSRTMYYYSLTPQYNDLVESKCGTTFNNIIPLINDEED